MTTNERIKEIAEKALGRFKHLLDNDCQRGAVESILREAIIESTKDLSATIEAQRKEIAELMKDKARLDFITTHSFDCRELNYISMSREIIDSAISKQKE